jgi:hypothetical protein
MGLADGGAKKGSLMEGAEPLEQGGAWQRSKMHAPTWPSVNQRSTRCSNVQLNPIQNVGCFGSYCRFRDEEFKVISGT